jgi:hypothetical protein
MQPGHNPMMGGPMMGGPHGPHGAMMPPRPMKRGVSRIVPVVVSAGLAVGVFCGLLFGLGTGDQTAAAEPSKGNNLHPTKESEPSAGAAPAGLGATAATPPPPKAGPAGTGSGSSTSNPVATATGSAAATGTPVAAGSAAGSAAGAPTIQTAKLVIEVEPAAAASVAKITIDGKEITGNSIELAADKKSVKVSVTATGYHSVDKKVDVTGGTETKVQLELTKRSTGGGSPGFGGASTGGNHVPTAPPKPKKPPNSGIIDI